MLNSGVSHRVSVQDLRVATRQAMRAKARTDGTIVRARKPERRPAKSGDTL